MKYLYKLIVFITLICFSSCIKDDFPVRVVEGNIEQIELEGQIDDLAVIDKVNRTVKIKVNDAVDLKKLKVRKFVVSNDASVQIIGYPAFPSMSFSSSDNLPDSLNTVINFEQPVYAMLKTYQEYKWKISVEQVIDRIGGIKVEGQFGDPVIDEDNHTIIIYVTDDVDLRNVTVKNMAIGGSAAVVTPDASTVKDFSRPCEFTVTSHGESTLWTVSILQTEDLPGGNDVSVWATKAYISGSMKEGTVPQVEFKKKSDLVWNKLPVNAISTTGGTFKAFITGLQPSTPYNYRVTIGSTAGDEESFTTEGAPLIANLNFDSWSQDNKTWFPNADPSDSYWGTGNPGVTVIGKESNSTPSTDAVKGKSARLETVKVPLVGLAAGNLFTGGFKTNLASPISSVRFGRHFVGRPSKLKGYYKYKGGVIDASDSDHKNQIGQPERFHIYISLENWGSTVEKDKDGYEIRPNNRTVVGYGELVDSKTVDSYKEFTINIDYKETNIKPTHVVLVATSSFLGDYFTGCVGSTLFVDELELVYD